jgi:hypothetical protein
LPSIQPYINRIRRARRTGGGAHYRPAPPPRRAVPAWAARATARLVIATRGNRAFVIGEATGSTAPVPWCRRWRTSNTPNSELTCPHGGWQRRIFRSATAPGRAQDRPPRETTQPARSQLDVPISAGWPRSRHEPPGVEATVNRALVGISGSRGSRACNRRSERRLDGVGATRGARRSGGSARLPTPGHDVMPRRVRHVVVWSDSVGWRRASGFGAGLG